MYKINQSSLYDIKLYLMTLIRFKMNYRKVFLMVFSDLLFP